MEQKIVQFRNRGMRQDESISKASDEFAFKNINVRITAVNDNTLFSVTNEKGPIEINLYTRLRKVPIYADYNSESEELYCYTNSPVKSDVTIVYQYGDWSEYTMTILSGETKSNSVNLSGSPYEPDGNFNPKHQEDNECIYYPFYEGGVPQGGLFKSSIIGSYIGKCIIDKYLIIFTKQKSGSIVTNRIYRLEFKHGVVDYTEEDYIFSTLLVESNNLNILSPVETVGSYERDDIIKVYWVDGVNPNRVINVMTETQPDSFDFLPTVNDFPSISVTKQYGGNGKFPAGVIQYFVSYYNKLGQETKIVAATDLQYISFKDRGGKADEIVNLSFILELSNLDTSFDYVRVYSAKRSSIDGPIDAQIVGDYNIDSTSVRIIDNNIAQASIDSSLLYYIGGDSFIASTIEDKDGVLFFGNIEATNSGIIPSNIKDQIKSYCIGNDNDSNVIEFDYYDTNIVTQQDNFGWLGDFTEYNNEQSEQTCFKSGETYRFAIQLQSNTGEWSEPIYIGDKTCSKAPKTIPGKTIKLATAKLVNVSFLDSISDKYSKYRVLMAETSQSTRKIIAQGILTPTVFNVLERYNDSPSFIYSWFIRGMKSRGSDAGKYTGLAPGQHYDTIYRGNIRSSGTIYNDDFLIGEIQCVEKPIFPKLNPDGDAQSFCQDNNEQYYIDRTVVTMNSPEILYGNPINKDGVTLSIVGIVPISNVYTDFTIDWENSHNNSCRTVDYDGWFYDLTKTFKYPEMLKSGYLFECDEIDSNGNITEGNKRRYKLYAWNKTGSIVGQLKLKNNQTVKYDTLKHKIFSNFSYSSGTYYLSSNVNIFGNNEFKIFDSDELTTKKIDNKSRYYYGNYDKLLTPKKAYSVEYRYTDVDSFDTKGSVSNQVDPIRIKYKSQKHGIISLPSENFDYCLPGFSSDNIVLQDGTYPWGYMSFGYGLTPTESFIGGATPNINDYLIIAELVDYNVIPYDTPTEDNLKKLSWIPIGDAKNLNETTDRTTGDTYYKRWDCLRTYPWTEEDENSVVDIVSFMVETHINLDGRCDINKGYTNQLNARPTNFGLMNDVYSQHNNIFKYNILDERFDHRSFQNQFAWSLNKQDVSEIDAWTSATLSNIKNVDGSYGPINAIEKLNDTLIGFQDRAIFAINFNNRTQISTEQGLPIELANSGKVDGVTYITRNYGCKNKYSIVNAKSGIYFIDDENRALIRIGKDGLADISTAAGMSVWFRGLNSYNNIWNGGSLEDAIVLQYDSNRGDIYIMRKNDCIVYNEILQCFTSFFDNRYEFPLMYNFGGETYSLYGNSFYKMFGGAYLNNYSIDYRINPEPLTDKVFTNLEYIADCTDSDNDIDTRQIIESDIPFSKIEAWNEYQYGSSDITEDKFMPNNYKQKFRIRRVDIPRASGSKYGMDRMRNPWIHLRISKTSGFNHKMTFHSMLVKYFK